MNSETAPPIELYLHVPFCEKKCHYCDFASWEMPAVQQRRWFEVVMKELEFRAIHGIGRRVETVFFGGGTPSLLATEFLEKIVVQMHKLYDLSHLREMSIECNPSSLTQEKLELYHRLGFTRLSLGIQSFSAEELTKLGRVHTVETAGQALAMVRADGRFQFSGDLIFGVPGQTQATFLASLAKLLTYDPDHISFYGLTIEDGTEFAKQQASGALILPEDGIYNEMYTQGVALILSHGYERYEVSNFSKPGRECKHNVGYWTGVEYLSFGPGAHALLNQVRTVSPRSFESYLDWGRENFNETHSLVENLSPENRVSESVLLGLRQKSGLDLQALVMQGFALPNTVVSKWQKAGMIAVIGSKIHLVDDGWLFLDEIGADFLARGKMV